MLTDTILRNRYKILKELGRGGFSVTYLAVDMDLPGHPKCVVKQLKTQHSNKTILQIAKKLFDREAQVLYRLGKGHKQIPEMLAHFEENDEFYLVQEFVDGHDLTKEIKHRHRLSEEKVIKLLQEILEILTFVHENNVIHRDIKLRNIMRRRQDGKIVLIDFGAVKEIKGLVKNKQGDVNSTLIIGTPGYMPDEQANGKPRLCSDIYAVGMLGIQALTGMSPRELPFNPDNGELIWRNWAKVSDKLAEILTGMVRHHFSQRYQTAAEALEALKSPVPLPPKNFSHYHAIPATLPPKVPQSAPGVLKTLSLVGLMGFGFGLGIFGWSFFQSTSNRNQPSISNDLSESKSINRTIAPQNSNNQNPKIFLPSIPKAEGSKTKPVFLPFIPFFNEKKIQNISETAQPAKNKNAQPVSESKIKPISPIVKPDGKSFTTKQQKSNSAPTFLTPSNQHSQTSLPSISVPPSKKDKQLDNPQTSSTSKTPTVDKDDNPKTSPASKTPTVDKDNNPQTSSASKTPTVDKDNNPQTSSTSTTPTVDTDELKDDNPQTSSTSTTPTVDTDELKDDNPQTSSNSTTPTVDENKQLDDNPQTSSNSTTPTVDENKQLDDNPQTSSTPTADSEEKQLDEVEQPKNQTPASPLTPAIEIDSPSPQPTPSPTKTTDSSIVVPTAPPSENPPEENHNHFFLTIPTSPTPTPEIENQPTFSPQPTPTPESKTESTASPQPTETPQAENQPNTSPQPTATPKAENQPTPQVSATPTPETEIEVIPQASATPNPETEIEVIPQASATPTPETEIEVIPQASATPTPETEIKVIPQASVLPLPEATIQSNTQASPSPKKTIESTPLTIPTKESGLSLKRFAI